MKVAVYSTKSYDRKYLELINAKYGLELEFYDFMLSERTAKMAEHCEAVCIFVNDDGSRKVLEKLAALGVKIIALRCAGFNNVDLKAAQELGLTVVRVPAYSPEAVAEHTVGLMMTLNRRIHPTVTLLNSLIARFRLVRLTSLVSSNALITSGKLSSAHLMTSRLQRRLTHSRASLARVMVHRLTHWISHVLWHMLS